MSLFNRFLCIFCLGAVSSSQEATISHNSSRRFELPSIDTLVEPLHNEAAEVILPAPIVISVQSADVIAASQQQTRDYTLQMKTGKFDPIAGQRRAATAAEGAGWYIVQFQHSLTRTERKQLQKQHGLKLNEYIPNFAYIERLEAPVIATLGRDPLVRWIGPYAAEYKIDPTIGKHTFKTDLRKQGGLLITLTLFPDAEATRVAENARKTGVKIIAVNDDTKSGGQKRMTVEATSSSVLQALAAIPEIKWIEETPERTLRNAAATAIPNNTTTGVIQSGAGGNAAANTPIWEHGLHGEGQIVGMIDDPIDLNHCFFQDPTDNTIRPAHRKVVGSRNVGGGDTGDFGHGTHTSGTAAGDDFNNLGTANNRGIAWAARLTWSNLCGLTGLNCGSSAGTSSVINYLQQAHNDGAHIHSNSWGSGTTTYDQDEADIDTFVWQNEDDLVIVAANEQAQGMASPVASPESAKDSIAVNASPQSPNQNSLCYGATGPTPDGRRKPEIFAPGCNINSAQENTACGIISSANFFPGVAGGTSMAAPAISAGATMARQYYTEGWYPTGTREAGNSFTPSGALIKATVLNATIDMTGLAGYPGNVEGWGILDLQNTLFFQAAPTSGRRLRVWDTANAHGFLSGDPARTHIVTVASNTLSLKATLVWTEPPAAVSAANPVTNNLDLTVSSQDGTQTFRGNVFAANGFSATGGTADTVNNVEQVWIQTPAPGNWTITVTPTTVNVGNPGQGYALVATADMPAPPPTTGTLDTIVVPVSFSDIVGDPSKPNLTNTVNTAADYITKNSYGGVTITPTIHATVALDHGKDWYSDPSRNPLIELTQEVVGKIAPSLTPAFQRIIIVTNDDDFTGDWATTGPWPYDLPGGLTQSFSVSIQGQQNGPERFAHGLGHQFNLIDLYAHEGVTFPRFYADEWDNMAKPFRNEHFLAWSKERAQWLTSHGDEILFIPRPAAGASYTGLNPIPIFDQESTTVNRKGIAIGLTNGVTALASEKTFYFIEARDKNADTYEKLLPSSGVLIYLVNTMVPQGQGPVILLDKDPGTPQIEAFQIGDARTIPGTGITISVQAGTGGAAFNINVAYTAPTDNYNVHITRGDTGTDGNFYSYLSSDIWVDSPKNGGNNLATGPPPRDQRENPVEGMPNKVYVRISNDGPARAENFDVRLRVSDPYHTLGDSTDFNTTVGIQHISGLVPAGQSPPPGMLQSPAILTFQWTPKSTSEAHACGFADFLNLTGNDTNAYDNDAQENFTKVTSVNGSPFHATDFHFTMKNPYQQQALFYFHVNNVPPHWSVVVNPPKALLDVGQRIEAVVTITPPPDEKLCSSRTLEAVSWTPRGDTLVRVGGTVVQVDMRRPTELTFTAAAGDCVSKAVIGSTDSPAGPVAEGRFMAKSLASAWRFEDQLGGHSEANRLLLYQQVPPVVEVTATCRRVVGHGCTNPPLPNQTVWVKYISSDGKVIWHQVTTDANGCFEDFIQTTSGANWDVTAGFDGGDCQGPVRTPPQHVVPGAGAGLKSLWYSLHLGHNFSLGGFGRNPALAVNNPANPTRFESGPSITFDLEKMFRAKYSIYAMVGYHYFDANQPGIADHWLTNFSVNVRLYQPAGSWRWFVGSGPGIYRDNNGTAAMGLNASTGLEFPIKSKFAAEAGADFHFVHPGGASARYFVDPKLGIKWQF